MALIFDLNTGRFFDEPPLTHSSDLPQSIQPGQTAERTLGMELFESTQLGTVPDSPFFADLAEVDVLKFIRKMEHKER